MSDWIERFHKKCEEDYKKRLDRASKGCCVEEIRKKYVAKGLIPEEIQPMSEEEWEKYKIPEYLSNPRFEQEHRFEQKPKEEKGITSGLEYEKSLQKLAREQMKLKLLKDIATDMQVCELIGTDPLEYPKELKSEIDAICAKARG